MQAVRGERSQGAQETRDATEDDTLAAIESTLDDMQAQEPERFANDQSVRVINAVAATIYAYFVLSMRWFSFGESCEWCKQLDGRVIGPSSWFLEGGGSLQDAAGTVFKVGGNVRHAPLHDGCDCQVLAA